MAETPLDPPSDCFTAAADDHGRSGEAGHKAHEHESPDAKLVIVLRVRNRLHRGREKEDRKDHQDGEGPKVKYSLDRPYSHLRGKWKILAFRDEIGTNELPGTSQQRQAGKPDQRR